MPRFDLRFAAEAQAASDIVQAGEMSRANGLWSPKQIEFLYELAYLRVFVAWETTLESIFLRSLCGYASSAVGQETLSGGHAYYGSIRHAELAVLGTNHFLLWHDPARVINRCNGHIISGRQASVISSNLSGLERWEAVRHRVVHDQDDSRQNFNTATLAIAGRTYPASRPGKFLRDLNRTVYPHVRWLETAIGELTGLAGQMV